MLETAVRYGVSNYLLKPVTMEKFVEAVEEYKKEKLLSYRDEVDQTLIDRYFGVANQLSSAQKDLPSGVDRHTLEK